MASSKLVLLRNVVKPAVLSRPAAIGRLPARSFSVGTSDEQVSSSSSSSSSDEPFICPPEEDLVYGKFTNTGRNTLKTDIIHCCDLNVDDMKVHYNNSRSTDGHAVEDAFDLFLSTVKEDFPINEVCHSYVEKLCRSGKVQDISHLLRHFHTRQIPVSLKTYNHLLAAADEVDDFDLSFSIFKDLLLSSSPPDLSSYTILAKCLRKVDYPQTILNFTRVLSEITADRDPTVMNRIIFILAKVGQSDTALMIYEDMKVHNCKMDTVTFNTALAVLGKDGQVNRMLSEFTLMKELGHTPDIITYNTLINSLHRFGRLDLCSVFIKEMSDKGIKLDLLTYTAIIDSFGRAGRTEDAIGVLDEMKKFRVQPSIYIYRALVSNLKKAAKFDLANSLLEEMKSVASKLLGPQDIKQIKRKKS